ISFGNRKGIAVLRAAGGDADVSTARDDTIEGTSVHDKVSHYGKRFCAPGLEVKDSAFLEVPHVKLADGGGGLWTVRHSIHHEAARSANPFTAIVIESNRLFTFRDEFLVEHIEHLQKRHVRIHIRMLVLDHAPSLICVFLPPNVESKFHYL